MWNKVHQFRENWDKVQNLTAQNFFVFELWPTKFWDVALPECFQKMSKMWTNVHHFREKLGQKFRNLTS